jgi:hypothetical protein
MNAVAASIKAPFYKAWVVSEPTVTVGDGTTFDGQSGTPIKFSGVSKTITDLGNDNVNDVGGAAIVLTYTPVSGLVINNPLWIQVYRGRENGTPREPTLDCRPSENSPFYASNASGTLTNGDLWLVDRPFTIESEPDEPEPVANLEFVTLLAGQELEPNTLGGNTDVVTIYGGVDWGYTYTAADVPEPSTLALLGLGTFSLLAYDWRRRKAKA